MYRESENGAFTVESKVAGPWTEKDVLDALNWRYAVQQFDPNRKIPESTWRTLEEALRLAPSAFGLQPWKFIVVTDQAVKEKLVEHSWGQSKIADASHLLVIASRTDHTAEDTARLVARYADVRNVELASLDGLAAMINGSTSAQTTEARGQWLKRQAYIALGLFVAAAAMLRVDVAPMEGFVPQAYDEILDLSGTGYTATVIAAAGYRAATDKYSELAKARYAYEDVVQHV